MSVYTTDAIDRAVEIAVEHGSLEGSLVVPNDAKCIVLFAHGSGSSRHSPRNLMVAESLQQQGMGTLLIDLLSAREEAMDSITRQHRFDIPLLSRRLIAAIDWLASDTASSGLHLGLFGASTGGAAALVAAAERPERVRAVVSRGGRPDLAGAALMRVEAPTLLIVGERDEPVIELNREAMKLMTAEVQLEIIPRATHLFEEPGALGQVASLAGDWFLRYA